MTVSLGDTQHRLLSRYAAKFKPLVDDPQHASPRSLVQPRATADSRPRCVRCSGCVFLRAVAGSELGECRIEPAVVRYGMRSGLGFDQFGTVQRAH